MRRKPGKQRWGEQGEGRACVEESKANGKTEKLSPRREGQQANGATRHSIMDISDLKTAVKTTFETQSI
jgi:hypothetical protein